MSAAPTNPALPVRRSALGLPAGSVRAVHVLGIVALVCGILLVSPFRAAHVPPYLIYLLLLGVGHYFAAHGNTIARRDMSGHSPLYLPAGVVRLLVMAMLGGTIGWLVYAHPDALHQSFDATIEEMKMQPYMLLVILGAFFVGVVIRAIVGHDNPPVAWQEFEAWLSLLALVGLFVAVILHLVIGVSLRQQLSLPFGEGVLGAGIAFYFGARS